MEKRQTYIRKQYLAIGTYTTAFFENFLLLKPSNPDNNEPKNAICLRTVEKALYIMAKLADIDIASEAIFTTICSNEDNTFTAVGLAFSTPKIDEKKESLKIPPGYSDDTEAKQMLCAKEMKLPKGMKAVTRTFKMIVSAEGTHRYGCVEFLFGGLEVMILSLSRITTVGYEIFLASPFKMAKP